MLLLFMLYQSVCLTGCIQVSPNQETDSLATQDNTLDPMPLSDGDVLGDIEKTTEKEGSSSMVLDGSYASTSHPGKVLCFTDDQIEEYLGDGIRVGTYEMDNGVITFHWLRQKEDQYDFCIDPAGFYLDDELFQKKQ